MRHWLEYVAVRALVAIVGVMPASLARACGALLGFAWYVCNRSRRRMAAALGLPPELPGFLHRPEAALDAYQFVFESPRIKPGAGFADYASESFLPARPLTEALLDPSLVLGFDVA